MTNESLVIIVVLGFLGLIVGLSLCCTFFIAAYFIATSVIGASIVSINDQRRWSSPPLNQSVLPSVHWAHCACRLIDQCSTYICSGATNTRGIWNERRQINAAVRSKRILYRRPVAFCQSGVFTKWYWLFRRFLNWRSTTQPDGSVAVRRIYIASQFSFVNERQRSIYVSTILILFVLVVL